MHTNEPEPLQTFEASFASLMLGIDPQSNTLEELQTSLTAHTQLLSLATTQQSVSWLKPNLSFFLRHGSKGITLLESNVESWKSQGYKILLDAKFSEISHSLTYSLDFCFKHLKAHAVTLNPFLGEQSIQLAIESCEKNVGNKGIVFVLCNTSQQSTCALQHYQNNPHLLLQVLCEIQKNHSAQLGAVVGAMHLRHSAFHRQDNTYTGPFLCPGLGAQGVSASDVMEGPPAGPCFFPVSRSVFEGGGLQLQKMTQNLNEFLQSVAKIERSWHHQLKEQVK